MLRSIYRIYFNTEMPKNLVLKNLIHALSQWGVNNLLVTKKKKKKLDIKIFQNVVLYSDSFKNNVFQYY